MDFQTYRILTANQSHDSHTLKPQLLSTCSNFMRTAQQ